MKISVWAEDEMRCPNSTVNRGEKGHTLPCSIFFSIQDLNELHDGHPH